VGVSHFLENDKKKNSLSLTLCDMLGANTFIDPVISDATALVYLCQPNLMTFQTIFCLAFNVKKGAN